MIRRTATGYAVLAVIFCAVPVVAVAGDAVSLRIGCVLASNSGQEIDKRIVDLRPRFARLFRYTSYYLVKEKRETVPLGQKLIFEIPGGRFLMVLPKQQNADGTILMKVVLLEGARPIINTSVSLKKHGTFLVGGPQSNNGALILAIAADPTPQP